MTYLPGEMEPFRKVLPFGQENSRHTSNFCRLFYQAGVALSVVTLQTFWKRKRAAVRMVSVEVIKIRKRYVVILQ